MFIYLEICGLISLQIHSGHCLFWLLIDFEAGEIITKYQIPCVYTTCNAIPVFKLPALHA